MSYHTKPSPEVLSALRAERNRATMQALIIALLAITLLALILYYFVIKAVVIESPPIVAYSVQQEPVERVAKKEVKLKKTRKPSAPASAATRALTSQAEAAVEIPVSEADELGFAANFGGESDFGSSWEGEAQSEMVSDLENASDAAFFGQITKTSRVVYVIDVSRSLDDVPGREELMRRELRDSLGKLGANLDYQLLFFATAVWAAGSDIEEDRDTREVEIEYGGETYRWKNYKTVGKKQKFPWLKADSDNISLTKRAARRQELYTGGNWRGALEMALEMDPAPEVIFFMCDGEGGDSYVRQARRVTRKAKESKTRINAVSMMEPNSYKWMKELAVGTGGSFSIAERRGKVQHIVQDGKLVEEEEEAEED